MPYVRTPRSAEEVFQTMVTNAILSAEKLGELVSLECFRVMASTLGLCLVMRALSSVMDHVGRWRIRGIIRIRLRLEG